MPRTTLSLLPSQSSPTEPRGISPTSRRTLSARAGHVEDPALSRGGLSGSFSTWFSVTATAKACLRTSGSSAVAARSTPCPSVPVTYQSRSSSVGRIAATRPVPAPRARTGRLRQSSSLIVLPERVKRAKMPLKRGPRSMRSAHRFSRTSRQGPTMTRARRTCSSPGFRTGSRFPRIGTPTLAKVALTRWQAGDDGRAQWT